MPFDLDEEYLVAAEQVLESVLPKSYRETMMVENGGEIFIGSEEWQLHPVFDKKNKKQISRTCNDIVRETRMMAEWRDWPSQAVAIGANGCGDALVFLREGNSCGPELYEWSHETGELRLMAHNFDELRKGE